MQNQIKQYIAQEYVGKKWWNTRFRSTDKDELLQWCDGQRKMRVVTIENGKVKVIKK